MAWEVKLAVERSGVVCEASANVSIKCVQIRIEVGQEFRFRNGNFSVCHLRQVPTPLRDDWYYMFLAVIFFVPSTYTYMYDVSTIY